MRRGTGSEFKWRKRCLLRRTGWLTGASVSNASISVTGKITVEHTEAEPYFTEYAAYIDNGGVSSTRTLDADPESSGLPLLVEETRVVKFVLVDNSKRIFSWIRPTTP